MLREFLTAHPSAQANYHVMYYFARGASADERAKSALLDASAYDSLPPGAGAHAGRLTADEQAAAWTRTADALATVGFSGDEKAEIAYLLKADDDPAELRAYAATARKALDEFLAMLPPP